MFGYLRTFSLFSFVAIFLFATLIGFSFRSIATGDMTRMGENTNVSLAQGFINTIWKRHRPALAALPYDIKTWSSQPALREFGTDTFRYVESMPVAGINVYTGAGVLLLSTDMKELVIADRIAKHLDQATSAQEAPPLTRVKGGTVDTQALSGMTFHTMREGIKEGALVKSTIPIFSPATAGSKPVIEGIIELFYDVTTPWENLSRFQVIGTGSIIFLFLLLTSLLVATSRKAEAIISKQHETNVELAAAAASAQAENREKSMFLANISHELRTPLNAIIGFSDIMKTEMSSRAEKPGYLDHMNDIYASGVHLLSLINDILDYSKAEAGKLDLEIEDVDATKIAVNCMRLVTPRAESGQVSLVDALPKSDRFILTTDGKKLKQILLNLLSNAVKFTPQGGEVRLSGWRNVTDNSVSFEVKDTGIGIAPKDISRAMSLFGQVDSELSRRYEGTGLGLPLTKKFVELMGGKFHIESQQSVGTTIMITLPRAIDASAGQAGRRKAASDGT